MTSLRDQLALVAMEKIMDKEWINLTNQHGTRAGQVLATTAYQVADDMMARRGLSMEKARCDRHIFYPAGFGDTQCCSLCGTIRNSSPPAALKD